MFGSFPCVQKIIEDNAKDQSFAVSVHIPCMPVTPRVRLLDPPRGRDRLKNTALEKNPSRVSKRVSAADGGRRAAGGGRRRGDKIAIAHSAFESYLFLVSTTDPRVGRRRIPTFGLPAPGPVRKYDHRIADDSTLSVGCGLETRMDIEVVKPKSGNSTPDENVIISKYDLRCRQADRQANRTSTLMTSPERDASSRAGRSRAAGPRIGVRVTNDVADARYSNIGAPIDCDANPP
ncbi:hypothetical protein EVAR_41740_1 [Eumeta japonica]|uniref:Uncharacterized protein n=1 Tax=Eumeta variegata TaxID=151549 RepID=A0A4C1W149_EUMVA|nr:hypothetical protein EVAR_41740_1 [Eumeta japonica]